MPTGPWYFVTDACLMPVQLISVITILFSNDPIKNADKELDNLCLLVHDVL